LGLTEVLDGGREREGRERERELREGEKREIEIEIERWGFREARGGEMKGSKWEIRAEAAMAVCLCSGQCFLEKRRGGGESQREE
jgi:hypothetical protein